MSNANSPNIDEEIETALLDAELFLKYRAPQRAIEALRNVIERRPGSVELREKLRDIATIYKQPEEAARQCLMLANIYITRENFDLAQERLLQAKQLNPRISIATGLEAIRRARRPDLQVSSPAPKSRAVTLAGDLSVISIFDAVQVIENARLTGTLAITSGAWLGSILFNDGRIVGANSGQAGDHEALRRIVETTDGTFEFERSAQAFPVTINASSNTSLLLDMLRELDEEKM